MRVYTDERRFDLYPRECMVVFSFYKLGPFDRCVGSREGAIVIDAFINIYTYTQWQSSPGNNNSIMYKSRRKLLRLGLGKQQFMSETNLRISLRLGIDPEMRFILVYSIHDDFSYYCYNRLDSFKFRLVNIFVVQILR